MSVLSLELNLTDAEADRIVRLLSADWTACHDGLAAYVEGKVNAARAEEAAREARVLTDGRLQKRLAEIRAKATT